MPAIGLVDGNRGRTIRCFSSSTSLTTCTRQGTVHMKVFFINNDGGGFADTIDVPERSTMGRLFQERVPHGKAADYLIRVNRQPVAAEHVLQEGDRVSVTPVKIEGAGSLT
jgi:hypothetical protein